MKAAVGEGSRLSSIGGGCYHVANVPTRLVIFWVEFRASVGLAVTCERSRFGAVFRAGLEWVGAGGLAPSARRWFGRLEARKIYEMFST